MRIAVTYENGQIFQHFGHTETFKIYDVEEGKVVHSEVVDTNGSGHGALAGVLNALNADVLICGGIGSGAALDDPIGEVLGMKKRPNGLMIGQKRVPLGVVGIIYEARPNVTADAFALCFKTGNVVILKGGSDAIHSNIAIVETIRKCTIFNKFNTCRNLNCSQ